MMEHTNIQPATCSYPQCDKLARSRGMCEAHYQRFRSVEPYFLKAEADEGDPDPYTWHAVYIIGAHEIPYLKVGRSGDVWSRLLTMQTGCPFELRVFGAYFAKPAAIISLEWDVHKVLADCETHHRGEWFCLTPGEANAVVQKVIGMRRLNVLPFERFRKVVRDRGWSMHMARGWDDRLERAWLSMEGTRMASGGN